MCCGSYVQDVIWNYKILGCKVEILVLLVVEVKLFYDGLFKDVDYNGVIEVFINKMSGWVVVGDCLQVVIKRVMEFGVKYVIQEVLMFIMDKG